MGRQRSVTVSWVLDDQLDLHQSLSPAIIWGFANQERKKEKRKGRKKGERKGTELYSSGD